MAKLSISAELLEDLVFGFAEFPVTIRGARFSDIRNAVEFEVDGPDIPAVAEVRAEVTVRQNRRGEKFHTMAFKPVE